MTLRERKSHTLYAVAETAGGRIVKIAVAVVLVCVVATSVQADELLDDYRQAHGQAETWRQKLKNDESLKLQRESLHLQRQEFYKRGRENSQRGGTHE